ncbi:MAG: ISAzo13 family transposase, partial [Planctomycetaceae bacterium]|nr:ISAzo13 family transposase [Planctomycetaceae bacterium]
MDHGIITTIGNKYKSISRFLSDERSRRVWAATEAASLGRGGIS